MRRHWAALGSTVFFGVAPGLVAGIVPRRLTGWRMRPVPGGRATRTVGATLTAAGGLVLTTAFARFVTEGAGTPAPVAPPENLVVGGAYRHVRNPMYVAVLTTITGQALLLGQPVLAAYATGVAVPFNLFVRLHEEPHLRRTFGAAYDDYTRNVPRWRPRLQPWAPS